MQDRVHVIIVAGGIGSRMGSSRPKQFLELDGSSILDLTLDNIQYCFSRSKITIVLPFEWLDYGKEHYGIYDDVQIVAGGDQRFHSVKNGLSTVSDAEIIAIHDAVRPFITPKMVSDLLKAADEFGAAIPVTPVKETIRQLDTAGTHHTVDRDRFRLVQTPQCFKSELLLKAYEQDYVAAFTDDASVIEAMGHEVQLVEGSDRNIKITTPEDLELARCLNKPRS